MKKWKKSEKKAKDEIKGKRVPGSGAGMIKGDVISENWLIESKETSKERYYLELKVLKKLHRQALMYQRKPLLRFSFSEERIFYFFPVKDLNTISFTTDAKVRTWDGESRLRINKFEPATLVFITAKGMPLIWYLCPKELWKEYQ